MWNLSAGDCECDKAWKIDKYLDIKDFSCKKSLFGKLVLACEHEILNTAEKKKKEIIWRKWLPYLHCLIGNCMLIIISCHLY